MPIPFAGAAGANQDLATNKPTTKKGQRQLQNWQRDVPQRQPLVENKVTPQALSLFNTPEQTAALFQPPETTYSYDPSVPDVNAPSGVFKDSNALQEILFQASKSKVPFDAQAVPDTRAQLLKAMNPVSSDMHFTGGRGANPAAQGAVIEMNQERTLSELQQKLDSELRTERKQAIGANTLGTQSFPGNIKKREEPMTQAEYDALTPRQRAAVDFNTMLVDAVRTDRANQAEYKQETSPLEQRTYDAAVTKLFGEDRGSDMYAPETLAVLRQVFGDNTDDHGALSDYTSLKAAIGAKDINRGVLAPGSPADDTRNVRVAEDTGLVASDRSTLVDNLARGTQAMEAQLARGQALLNDPSMQYALSRERAQDVNRLGGDPSSISLGRGYYGQVLGYGDDEISAFFRQGFDNLADKSNDLDKKQVLGILAEKLSPEEFNAFLGYANNRAMMAEQYKMPLGTTDGVKYRSPEEFRQLLAGEAPGALTPTEQTVRPPKTAAQPERQAPAPPTVPPGTQGGY